MSAWTIQPLAREDVEVRVADFIAIASDVPNEYWSAENFLLDLNEKWTLSLCARIGSRPVGYAIISRPDRARAHLHHFMVASEQRGIGLGVDLLEHAKGRCGSKGCNVLSLKVAKDNHRAQKFYRRHGFSDMSEENGYLTMVADVGPRPA
jgi:ribosomal protein S18 acetylase RimI-like enzyme